MTNSVPWYKSEATMAHTKEEVVFFYIVDKHRIAVNTIINGIESMSGLNVGYLIAVIA